MQDTNNVLVFGELLLRLSSSEEHFISNDQGISLYPGGSEANVAASLGGRGIPVSYISCIPDNPLSNTALNYLADRGVEVSHTIKKDGRLGLYFLLSANGLSSGQVVYDRKHSTFSELMPGTIDWDEIVRNYSWFHWTAITPALSENAAAICKEALQAAKNHGLTISVDLNYRNKLWDYGKSPLEVMPDLVSYCNVIMGNIWAANKMLGTELDDTLDRNTDLATYNHHSEACASELFKMFQECEHIANTFRFMDNPKHNLFWGNYHTRDANFQSEVFETQQVVDRIGSGDAFMAGLIDALINNLPGQELINQATRAGYNKLFIKGDFGDGTF